MTTEILNKAVIAVILLSAISIVAFGADGDSNRPYGNSNPDRFRRARDKPDLLFEKGREIYGRKESGHGTFKYCVISPETSKPLKLKRKSIKPYDGASYAELARNIRNCKQPDESLADSFDKYDANAVLYYLKKRYEISLTRP